ncbi:hypothetical protein [Asticcacaulis sp. 201]|uniref:hypothetical protein n=1 Tax=Asticcacaulis sp. 201 TaxID=3028787 RepID=UPI002916FE9D|nr:hypothetical protein [Asticcacaulis sp. 201]MDV6331302.1 hypothetical protein [Asticcacaulis sp. 201]
MSQSWEAESLNHQVGFADGDGWAANIYTDRQILLYGPYTTSIPQGAHTAVWKMLVDNNTADQRPIVTLDVWDSTASKQLAITTLFRNAWSASNVYEYFGIPFSIDASEVGHAIEIRVTYDGYSYVRVDKVGYR